MEAVNYRTNYHYMTQEQRDLKRRRAKRLYQMKKRCYLALFALLFVISISLFVGNTRSKAENEFDPALSVSYHSIMIQSGDTLWSIASEQTAHIAELDCKTYVKEVMKINGLGSDEINYGDYLIIPVYCYSNLNL